MYRRLLIKACAAFIDASQMLRRLLRRDAGSRTNSKSRTWMYFGQLPKACSTRMSNWSALDLRIEPLARLRRRVLSSMPSRAIESPSSRPSSAGSLGSRGVSTRSSAGSGECTNPGSPARIVAHASPLASTLAQQDERKLRIEISMLLGQVIVNDAGSMARHSLGDSDCALNRNFTCVPSVRNLGCVRARSCVARAFSHAGAGSERRIAGSERGAQHDDRARDKHVRGDCLVEEYGSSQASRTPAPDRPTCSPSTVRCARSGRK